MGILGFENRTENWKTAQEFAPFFTNETAKIALAKRLVGENCFVPSSEVKLGLFWYGVRDYIYANVEDENEIDCKLIQHCEELLPCVLKQLKEFNRLTTQGLYEDAYRYKGEDNNRKRLLNNLKNTEIDIVLLTEPYLCIGEAKWRTDVFGSKSKDVLVHQLIRQRVMAEVLNRVSGKNLTVVQFVVLENTANKRRQLQFMMKNKYIKKTNVLCWRSIKKLAPRGS